MNNNKRKRKGKKENKIPNHKLAWPCSQNAKNNNRSHKKREKNKDNGNRYKT
jgi:hypothetical protein